jgi:hypothetical protein
MNCTTCGAPATSDRPCAAAAGCVEPRRGEEDPRWFLPSDHCLPKDLAILRAARELTAMVRVDDTGALERPGKTMVALALLRLMRAVEAADGGSDLKRDLLSLLAVADSFRAEVSR